MEKGSSRVKFLEACNAIRNLLDDQNFKILQKGQLLKKVAPDKDIYYEIYFQSSFHNSSCDIMLLPHINICSKSLQKWMAVQTKNPYSTGIIYSQSLGYISPRAEYKTWNFAGEFSDHVIKEVVTLLNQYALPIFRLFDDKQVAINFLKEHGTKFHTHLEDSLLPLPFMIYCANREDAEIFFNNYIKKCSYKRRFISLYKEMETTIDIDPNYSEFIGASLAKIAFINGLKMSI